MYSEKRHNVLKRLKREVFTMISEPEETWRQELILQLLLWTVPRCLNNCPHIRYTITSAVRRTTKD